MIYSKLEPRITLFQRRHLPFWISSIWHFENEVELGHTVTKRNDDYIHFQNGNEIAYTATRFSAALRPRRTTGSWMARPSACHSISAGALSITTKVAEKSA
jgi:hypothetical protein